MQRFFLILSLFFVLCYTPVPGWAQALPEPARQPENQPLGEYAAEKAKEAGKALKDSAENTGEAIEAGTEQVKESASPLSEDLKKIRETLVGGVGDNTFARGMIIALVQPMFLAAMFCLGLWAGQMSEKLSTIWVLPVVVYATIFIGAFITTYHSEWKPNLEQENFKFLSSLESTDAVTVVVGLLIGAAVGMRFVVFPILALVIAGVIGLGLGFSQSTDLGNHAILPFWAGFGLTGVLVNIFGIGFETFLESIKANGVTRALGLATVALSFFFGMQIW